MSPLQKSLAYDAVALVVTGTTALATEGTIRGIALLMAFTTLLKAPYDAWEARGTPDVRE